MRDTFLISLLVTFCLALACPEAGSANRKAERDSLWNLGVEHSKHGRFEESNAIFEKILTEYKLSKRLKKAAYSWLSSNAELDGDFQTSYRYLVLKKGEKHPSDNLNNLKLMSQLPPQSIERPAKDVVVKYMIDSLFYESKYRGCEIRLPVIIGGKEERLILDNGCAKFCVSSESFAKEHGIRPIGVSGDAVGVVDTVSMWFGICDCLSIGELVFKNIIFAVIPDKYIDNPVLEINAMLGANVFRLAGEMDFDNKERSITFPHVQQNRESNVTIDGDGCHFVEAEVFGDSLKLQLDLGAAKSALSAHYYQKNKAAIQASWTADTTHIGGVGGFQAEESYSVPELAISACGAVFVRQDAKISTKKKPNEDDEDGAIGNDFLLSFDKAILNLKKQFLYVE